MRRTTDRLTKPATWEALLYICCLASARIVMAQSANPPAAELTSIDSLRATAAAAATRAVPSSTGRIIAEAAALDSRLRLARCATPLQAVTTPPRLGQTRIYVAVSCSSGANWRINVPVDLAVEQPVLIVQTPIVRGEPIAPGHVRVERRRVPGLSQRYVADFESLQHHVARRPLSAGEIVTAEVLTPELVIKRGQEIVLLTDIAGISVRASGIALADASLNQRLRVRNLASQRVVEGQVESADTVRVSR
ncbi:MAG: flagellar basal body P-ring formation chaperone FlgA [Steroidobacteraceae bacterium]